MNTLASSLKKHRIVVITVISAIFIFFTSSLTYAELKKEITITVGNETKEISTFRTTVGEILQDENIVIGEQDILNIGTDEKLKDDLKISIKRKEIRTPVALGVSTESFDKPDPLIRTTFELKSEVKKEKIAYRKEVLKNPKMEKGTTKVVKKGKAGEKQITYNVTYANGKVISRQVASVTVTKNPVNAVTMEGTKNHISTSRGGKMVFTRAFAAEASAYWAGSCGKKKGSSGYGRTATGEKLKKGIVAVDPRVIPLGTWLYIEGYGVALAADTGGSIVGKKIDLAFTSENQCVSFGRRTVKVYVLDRPRFSF